MCADILTKGSRKKSSSTNGQAIKALTSPTGSFVVINGPGFTPPALFNGLANSGGTFCATSLTLNDNIFYHI